MSVLRRKTGRIRPTEAQVLLAVKDFLAMNGFVVYRQQAGSYPVRGGFARLAPRGAADLCGWHKKSGRGLQVEIKRPGKIPTQEQQQWLHEAVECGCYAFWADSVEMAEGFLRALRRSFGEEVSQ